MWSPRVSQSLYRLLTARLLTARLVDRLARRMALGSGVVRPLAAVSRAKVTRNCGRHRNGERPNCEDAGEELPSPHGFPTKGSVPPRIGLDDLVRPLVRGCTQRESGQTGA